MAKLGHTWYQPSTAHPVTRLDYRGRSVRCATCYVIVVHPEGNTDAPYRHWTDVTPDGEHTWACYTVRQAINGRLIVPHDWLTNPVHVTHWAVR